MKKCTCCHIHKPYEEFHRQGPGKFAARCKTCISGLQKIKNSCKRAAKKKMFEMRQTNSEKYGKLLGNYP